MGEGEERGDDEKKEHFWSLLETKTMTKKVHTLQRTLWCTNGKPLPGYPKALVMALGALIS